jgi:glucuronate isomerase
VKQFIDENWLIRSETGIFLYHEVVASLPIVDYHNHLNPSHIAHNKSFDDLAEMWVLEDPYKHRAMRINGIPEREITGDTSSEQKFLNWAATLPKTLGNPLFHWSCLELKRIFGIDEILNADNAREIWSHCNQLLRSDSYRAGALAEKWNTEILCTSDDLLDDLKHHAYIRSSSIKIKVLPSLRGDSLLDFNQVGYLSWLSRLSNLTNQTINHLDDFISCVRIRMDCFGENACVLSDHALDSGFVFEPVTYKKADDLFQQVLKGKKLTTKEQIKLTSYCLMEFGKEYGKIPSYSHTCYIDNFVQLLPGGSY